MAPALVDRKCHVESRFLEMVTHRERDGLEVEELVVSPVLEVDARAGFRNSVAKALRGRGIEDEEPRRPHHQGAEHRGVAQAKREAVAGTVRVADQCLLERIDRVAPVDEVVRVLEKIEIRTLRARDEIPGRLDRAGDQEERLALFRLVAIALREHLVLAARAVENRKERVEAVRVDLVGRQQDRAAGSLLAPHQARRGLLVARLHSLVLHAKLEAIHASRLVTRTRLKSGGGLPRTREEHRTQPELPN